MAATLQFPQHRDTPTVAPLFAAMENLQWLLNGYGATTCVELPEDAATAVDEQIVRIHTVVLRLDPTHSPYSCAGCNYGEPRP